MGSKLRMSINTRSTPKSTHGKGKQSHTVGRIKKGFSSNLVLLLGGNRFQASFSQTNRGEVEAGIVMSLIMAIAMIVLFCNTLRPVWFYVMKQVEIKLIN